MARQRYARLRVQALEILTLKNQSIFALSHRFQIFMFSAAESGRESQLLRSDSRGSDLRRVSALQIFFDLNLSLSTAAMLVSRFISSASFSDISLLS